MKSSQCCGSKLISGGWHHAVRIRVTQHLPHRAWQRFSRQRLVLCLAPRGPHAERHRADHQQDAY